ncbi:acetoin utilization protein AcuC [Cellulosimicrobium marinum]|uniref:acetoin utilization protein AcuC n=1 Tax=Cellulosimicrobium marinum TaxID=1638992 RepID=UPI001E53C94F|nr:acetoin utilization protein AcuC [Cellulosimicrobium marinum]MCB7138201.1 acetoin utilization protein AcuC [Cellulosimicrobium marinum]
MPSADPTPSGHPTGAAPAADAAHRACVAWSPDLLGYDFGPGHPMAPTRLDLTMRLVTALGLLDAPGVEVVAPGAADDVVLGTVHEAAYVAAVRAASDHGTPDPGRGLGTEDDPVFAGMHDAAARIVAASWDAAGAVASGRAVHAVNVAGGMHHAKAGAASGFCVYNDAAVAIRRLLADGFDRVAYVDLDAHHGDGVEDVFRDDPRVLTVSVHQSGTTLFPGTGHATDVGGPAAQGSAVNVALPRRTDGARWLRAVDAVVPPVLRAFRPQVLVTQHGCDAHGDDPLSDLDVSVGAQRAAATLVHDLAHELADGRWIALGGGGYAVARVVPLVWSAVVAEVVHAPVTDGTPLPEEWRALVAETAGVDAPETFGPDVALRPWSSGFDPADDVDRAVLATRRAVFPHLGLDHHFD